MIENKPQLIALLESEDVKLATILMLEFSNEDFHEVIYDFIKKRTEDYQVKVTGCCGTIFYLDMPKKNRISFNPYVVTPISEIKIFFIELLNK